MFKKLFEKVMTIACMALVLWIAASFIDVNLHNVEEHPTYASWNMFNGMYENIR